MKTSEVVDLKLIKTPEDLINFYVKGQGKDLSSAQKRVTTQLFLTTYPEYKLGDIKAARLTNKELKKLNSEATNTRYIENNKKTLEFAENSHNVYKEKDMELFLKLKNEGYSKLEIAFKMKRTFSSIEYLNRLSKNK